MENVTIYWLNWQVVLSVCGSSQCGFSFRSKNQILFSLYSFLSSSQCFDPFQLPFVSSPDRHTLWRCLQSTVTPILASMLEVMDRFANLDLLSDGRLSLVKLWLDILADSQILDLTPLQKPRYWGMRLLCYFHNESHEQNASFLFNIVVSQTRRCLCSTTSCWTAKNNPAPLPSAGSSDCTLKAFGKNLNLCQV